jgi:hypothetical protein
MNKHQALDLLQALPKRSAAQQKALREATQARTADTERFTRLQLCHGVVVRYAGQEAYLTLC